MNKKNKEEQKEQTFSPSSSSSLSPDMIHTILEELKEQLDKHAMEQVDTNHHHHHHQQEDEQELSIHHLSKNSDSSLPSADQILNNPVDNYPYHPKSIQEGMYCQPHSQHVSKSKFPLFSPLSTSIQTFYNRKSLLRFLDEILPQIQNPKAFDTWKRIQKTLQPTYLFLRFHKIQIFFNMPFLYDGKKKRKKKKTILFP